jgi:hypothetical protein
MAVSRGSWLRDLILGGQDGLTNVLGITLGLVAAGADDRIIIAAGMAATFAESTSMGAVAYTSSVAERDRYAGNPAAIQKQIRTRPATAIERSSPLPLGARSTPNDV